MPEGTKVGDVYVEGRLEYDEKNTPAFFSAMQRDVRRRLPDITSSIKQHFDTEMGKTGDSAGTALSNRLRTSLDRLKLPSPKLDVDVDSAMAEINKLEAEIRAIGRQDASVDVQLNTGRAITELEILRREISRNVEINLQVDTNPVKNALRTGLSELFDQSGELAGNITEFLRQGVSRGFVGLFTSPVGIGIGVAFVDMLVGAIGAGASFIGAALTGAIIGGLNLGVMAAGIALVADHPKIDEAADKLGKKFISGLDKAAEPFIDPVLKAIDRLDEALDKIMPNIERIMELVAPWVDDFADSLASVMENVAPALETLVEASGPIMEALADVLKDMGPALAGFLNALVSDPRAVEGAAQALRDIGATITAMLPALGDFLKELAITWPVIRPLVMEILGIIKRMLDESFDWDTFRENIRTSLEMIKMLLLVLEQVKKGFEFLSDIDPSNNAPAIKKWIEDVKADWNAGMTTIKDTWNSTWGAIKAEWNSFTASVKEAWNDFTGGIKEGLNDIRGAWREFRDEITSILDVVRGAWKTFRDDVKGALDSLGISDAWESFRRSLNEALEGGKAAWQDFRDTTKGIMNEVGAALDAFKAKVDQVLQPVKDAWKSLRDDINGVIEDIKRKWDELTDGVSSGASSQSGPLNTIREAWKTFRDDVNGVIEEIRQNWERFKTGLDTLGAGVFEKIKEDWKSFRDTVNGVIDEVRRRWDEFVSFFTSSGEGPITTVVNAVKERFRELRDAVQTAFNDIRSDVSGVMDEVRDRIEAGWTAVRESVIGAVDRIRESVEGGFENIREIVSRVSGEIRSALEDAWEAIRTNVFDPIIDTLQNALSRAFTELKDIASAAWNEIRTNVTSAWNQIRDAVFNEVNSRIDDLIRRFQSLRDNVTARWNEIRDTARAIWTEIRDQIFNPMGEFLTVTLPARYEEFRERVVRIFSEVRDTIGRIWNEMLTAAKGAVNAIAGFINGVIRAINQIPFMKDKLGELPGFADGGAVIQGKARGGAVWGGPKGTDTVPALSTWGQRYLLDNGEHILTKKDVQAMGGQKNVYMFRAGLHAGNRLNVRANMVDHPAPLRRATGGQIVGGRVGAQNNQLLQEHRDHVHVAMNVPPMGFPLIVAKAATSGVPFKVGSTFRPGSRAASGNLDHHSAGRAVDFPGFNQDAFASFWEKTSGVIELIHRTATRDYAIFGGGSGGGGGGLISWLLSAAGKAVKAAFDSAMRILKEGIGQPLLQGNTMAPGVLRNMFTHVADQLTSHFDFSSASGGGGTPAAPEQLKKWIEEARKYVTIEDVGRLITLIMRESGGNPRAINLTDINAQRGDPSKGLMQTIGATFSRYRDPRLPNDPFDPVANIVAGMNYIHARYGSLANVQQANANAPPMGYATGGEVKTVMDNGGWMKPGMSAVNLSGKPEPVFSSSQWDVLTDLAGAENLVVENKIFATIDGAPIDIKVQNSNQKIASGFRRGRGR